MQEGLTPGKGHENLSFTTKARAQLVDFAEDVFGGVHADMAIR